MSAMYRSQSPDTSNAADRAHFEMLRTLSPADRAQILSDLTISVQWLAFAGLRDRYPDASDDDLWLCLAARRLGRATVIKIYGRCPIEE